jgi:glycosyltransferase involved in cell wall biosynthesis
MKVLYITNNYPTKQFPVFGIFVKEQIDSLAELGINNEIFFINGREKGKFEYIRSIFRLRSFLKDKKYDLIHCHHALSALCLIMSGRMRNFKTIMSYQSNPVNEQGNYIYKFVKNSFDAVIIKNHSQVIDNKVVFCQPNGVNIDFFQPIDKEVCIKKLKLNKNKIYVLFVSSNHIRQEKRYDKFQATIEILKTKYNLHNIEELKLINIKRSLVPYYFNAASAHLLTSDFEGSPNSVKEAMACNLPVVSTNVGSVKELLQNVNGSYVAKTNEPEELADLIYKVLNETRKNNGREQLIKQELDIVSVAKKIKAIYKKVLN